MMDVRWIDKDWYECVTQFRTRDEARACAEDLRTRGVQDVHLLDDDGEQLTAEET